MRPGTARPLNDQEATMVRAYLFDHCMSQQDLANAVGVAQTAISSWLRGGRIYKNNYDKLMRIVGAERDAKAANDRAQAAVESAEALVENVRRSYELRDKIREAQDAIRDMQSDLADLERQLDETEQQIAYAAIHLRKTKTAATSATVSA